MNYLKNIRKTINGSMLIAFFKIRPETYVNLYFTCEYSSLTENGETRCTFSCKMEPSNRKENA